MNRPQMRRRWRTAAFMRATLEREIHRQRLSGASDEHIEFLHQRHKRYSKPWRNSHHPDADNRSFWELIAQGKLMKAVRKLWWDRRKSRKRKIVWGK